MSIAAPEEYLGRHLFVQPGYGWGWMRRDDHAVRVDYAQIQAEGGFCIRVRYFFTNQGEWRGLVGVVEQPGHQFDNFWIGCTARISGYHNFVDRICLGWNLDIGPSRPQGKQHWLPVGAPLYSGYGILAESEADIQAFRAKRSSGTV